MKMFCNLRDLLLVAILFHTSLSVSNAATIVVSGTICEETWTRDNIYLLDGYVSVPNACTLTIEPGTVIKGMAKPTDPNHFDSYLIVCKGGTLLAEGTAELPIVFTAEVDDTNNPFDLELTDRGLWGGVIIMGDAVVNSEFRILLGLINPGAGTCFDFSGNNNAHNGGILKYVSIRHAGKAISGDSGALTLAGVGAGTTVEYVDVFSSGEDGLTVFGGNVNLKYIISAFNSKDAFDFDQGWNGNGQFWFGLAANDSDRMAEHDGSTFPATAQPFSIPNISNVTFMGPGNVRMGELEAIMFQDAAGGRYINSIFCDQPGGIAVEANFDEPFTSNVQMQAGNLQIRNSFFGGGLIFIPTIAFNIIPEGASYDPNDIGDENQLNLLRTTSTNIFNASQNQLLSTGCPVVSNLKIDSSMALEPLPTLSSVTVAFTGVYGDTFFTPVTFTGAFSSNPEEFWAGFSHLDEREILAPSVSPVPPFLLYWTDAVNNEIGVANLDGNEVRRLLTSPVGGNSGIAIDSISQPQRIYFSSGSRIKCANLDGTALTTIIEDGLGQPFDVQFDLFTGKIYWSDIEKNIIQRSNLNGTDVETVVEGLVEVRRIVVDQDNRELYWADRGSRKIQKANLEQLPFQGGSIMDVVTEEEGIGEQLDGITVDPFNFVVYWSDSRALTIHRKDQFSDLVEEINFQNAVESLSDIFIDAATQQLYWSESNTLLRGDLNGNDLTGVETLASNLEEGRHFALHGGTNQLYWTTSGSDQVARKVLSDTATVDTLLAATLIEPNGLIVDDSNNDLYWVERQGRSIRALSLGGTDEIRKVISEDLSTPNGIALDQINEKLYWTDFDLGIGCSNLEGTERNLFETTAFQPINLTIDQANQKMYVLGREVINNTFRSVLKVADLECPIAVLETIVDFDNGASGIVYDELENDLYFTQISNIIKFDLDQPIQSGNPIKLITLEGQQLRHLTIVRENGRLPQLYWTNLNNTIQRANLDGSELEVIDIPMLGNPFGITIGKRRDN